MTLGLAMHWSLLFGAWVTNVLIPIELKHTALWCMNSEIWWDDEIFSLLIQVIRFKGG